MTFELTLEKLGWTARFEEAFTPWQANGYTVGRVALEHKHIYRVYAEEGELLAEVAGKLRHQALGREDYPAVGDWVVLTVRPEEGRATVHAVLPRTSKFSRKAAGDVLGQEQIVAANVDTVFLVQSLNQDFNPRRLERYLVMAWESGANPVIILTKADLCDDVDAKVRAMESVALGVPIFAVSSEAGTGLEQLAPYVRLGQTVALLGSSGVGKSTLINRLYGDDRMKTSAIREDDSEGRHTTTHRELVVLPSGGLLLDTPGMRELQLWDSSDGLADSFQDIEGLAANCRFSDCGHGTEPGCAVKTALAMGELDRGRWNSYVKLQKELAFLARKDDKRAQAAEREKWKKITMSQRGNTKKR